MSKVSKKSNLKLAIHLLFCFSVGWPLITVVIRLTHELSWALAVVEGLIFSGTLILISLISILHTRKKSKNLSERT